MECLLDLQYLLDHLQITDQNNEKPLQDQSTYLLHQLQLVFLAV